MSYHHTICEKVEKFRAFFNDRSGGQILVLISPYTFPVDYSRWGLEDRPLNTWDFKKELDRYIAYRVKKLRCFTEYTRELDNDYVPSLSGAMGIGLHSAYVSGADIILGEETSWVHPVIENWEDMYKLKTEESNPWFQVLKDMTLKISELCEGDYVPNTFAHFAPTDMANALRGNQLFYDFYDFPEKVHELLQISTDAIVWLEKELRKIVEPVLGGTVTANMWFPGGAPFLSEDAPDLCSAAQYAEFGAKYTQKVIDALDGAYIHHHAKGFHLQKEISKLNGLKTLEISWDPNCPRPVDHLSEVYEHTGEVPLMTRCTAADVYEKIEEIKKGRIVLMLNVKSLEEAREVVKFVRRHSKI